MSVCSFVTVNKRQIDCYISYDTIFSVYVSFHYEDIPIQIYWKFYHQKMKKFR